MKPKVSIIIPVFNSEKYIRRCLESITEQTLINFEAIIINDGSSDKSGLLCNQFAELDRRIRVYHQENKGVSATRNLGLELANGEYIGFVDIDDWIDRDLFEVLVDLAEGRNAELSVCGYYRNNESKVSLQQAETVIEMTQQEALEKSLDLEPYSFGVSIWNKLFRTDIMRENDLKFQEGISIGEDMIFLTQYLMNCRKIATTDRPLYHYFINEQGAVNASFHQKKTTAIQAHEEVKRLVNKVSPELGWKVQKRSSVVSFSLLKQAFKASYGNMEVIEILQKDVKRSFRYLLVNHNFSAANRLMLNVLAIHPSTYHYSMNLFSKLKR